MISHIPTHNMKFIKWLKQQKLTGILWGCYIHACQPVAYRNYPFQQLMIPTLLLGLFSLPFPHNSQLYRQGDRGKRKKDGLVEVIEETCVMRAQMTTSKRFYPQQGSHNHSIKQRSRHLDPDQFPNIDVGAAPTTRIPRWASGTTRLRGQRTTIIIILIMMHIIIIIRMNYSYFWWSTTTIGIIDYTIVGIRPYNAYSLIHISSLMVTRYLEMASKRQQDTEAEQQKNMKTPGCCACIACRYVRKKLYF